MSSYKWYTEKKREGRFENGGRDWITQTQFIHVTKVNRSLHMSMQIDKCTALNTHPHVIISVLSNNLYYLWNKPWHVSVRSCDSDISGPCGADEKCRIPDNQENVAVIVTCTFF